MNISSYGMNLPLFNFYIYPVFLLIELWLSRKVKWANYSWNETLCSISLRLLFVAVSYLYVIAFMSVFEYAAKHRLFAFHLDPIMEFFVYFAVVEFFYYWVHRYLHQVPIGWLSHITHHSGTRFNLINARRLGMLDPFSLCHFFSLPLIWCGFGIELFYFHLTLNLSIQLLLHTETIPKLGFFDKIFNSPSNHRVHHSVEPIYRDKNFGGLVMIFDHMFGTYQPELDTVKSNYGVVGGLPSQNPIRLTFIGAERLYKYWRAERPGFFTLLFKVHRQREEQHAGIGRK